MQHLSRGDVSLSAAAKQRRAVPSEELANVSRFPITHSGRSQAGRQEIGGACPRTLRRVVAAEPGSNQAGPLVYWKIFPSRRSAGPCREPHDHETKARLAKLHRPGVVVHSECTNSHLITVPPSKTDDGLKQRPGKGRIQIERCSRLHTKPS
jgi:hypothetical protein